MYAQHISLSFFILISPSGFLTTVNVCVLMNLMNLYATQHLYTVNPIVIFRTHIFYDVKDRAEFKHNRNKENRRFTCTLFPKLLYNIL